MAFERSVHSKTYRAASAILAMQPVALLGSLTAGSALDETIVPQGSWNIFPIGVARASAAIGAAVTVDLANSFAKCVAGASIGAGAFVSVGSTNGVVGQFGITGGGSTVSQRFALGIAEQNAAAGDIFTVQVRPQYIV